MTNPPTPPGPRRTQACLWCGAPGSVPRTVAANGAPCVLCRVCAGLDPPPLPKLLPKTAEQVAHEETLATLGRILAAHANRGPDPWRAAWIPFGFVHFGKALEKAITEIQEEIAWLERRRITY